MKAIKAGCKAKPNQLFTVYFMYKDVSKTELTKHNSFELIIPPVGEEKQGFTPKSQGDSEGRIKAKQKNNWHKSVNIMYISTNTKLNIHLCVKEEAFYCSCCCWAALAIKAG